MRLKKIISDLLCSMTIGRVIYKLSGGKIPSLRNLPYRFIVPLQYSNHTIHASIFWGFYESAEIRLINKFLNPNLPVIELGGSLGIISSFILHKLNSNTSLTVVEANAFLLPIIGKNIEMHNIKKIPTKIIHKAIAYSNSFIYLDITDDNTTSHISENVQSGSLVESIQLNNITTKKPYTLVCDIEGAEVELLLEDKEGLKNCFQLFIELHETTYKGDFYSYDDLKNLLIMNGFIFRSMDGNVIFLDRFDGC
jgi:FkbM family methyltransferase